MLESSPQSRDGKFQTPGVSRPQEVAGLVSDKWVKDMEVKLGTINTDLVRVTRGSFSWDVPKDELVSWLEKFSNMTLEERKGYGLWVNDFGPNAILYPFVDTFEVTGLSQP